ncbi:MAG: ABC transporter ATP-binding protein [Phycisphaerae bacterium]|nr:ABC transporter ATP-binding protein [Phycisphaerae bacterium]
MQDTTHQSTIPPTEVTLLLSVHDLTVEFATDLGRIRVVDGVSFDVPRRGKVAIVGESGCGKSVTVMSLLGLIPSPPAKVVAGRAILHSAHDNDDPTGGACHAHLPRWARSELDRVHLDAPNARRTLSGPGRTGAVDLLSLDQSSLRRIRGGRIAMIFQDPSAALHPLMTIGRQIVEAIELHRPERGRSARALAADLLARVGFHDPRRQLDTYPHQLSGGMRQRAMIAMALAGGSELLIADEPTTALDPTLQRQILDLLLELSESQDLAILLISHDLSVVARFAESVYVMYAGRIVESGPTAAVLGSPLHPYTAALLECLPRAEKSTGPLPVIPGNVPDPADFPPGCRFHPRCALTRDRALAGSRETIPLVTSGGAEPVMILRRCVEEFAGETSGNPPLREIRPGRACACWEAESPGPGIAKPPG